MSSANDIQGRNCLFQMKIDDVYHDVLCAKTFSFNRQYELKETTTVQSGFDKEYRPRKKSYTISFNGVVQVKDTVNNNPTIKTLFDYGEGFLPVPYRLIYEDNSGNVMVINGSAYVTSAIFNANPINLLDGTTELTGNGPFEILDYIPAFINVTVQVTGVADAKCRFILYKADGTIMYDTSTLLALLPTGGWLVQGQSVVMVVQKGQYAWGVSTSNVQSLTNTFDLDIAPPVHIAFGQTDLNQNSLPTVYDFLTDKTATFDIGATAPPPACVAPAIVGSPSLPDGTALSSYSYSFNVTGSTPFNITNVTKPSWMNISVSGNTVSINGLIGTGDTGTNIPVSFDINNACGSVTFSDTFDVNLPGTPLVDIDWSFTRGGIPFGTLRIFVNAALVIDANTTTSGSFSVNVGDVVEAQVIGLSNKTLTVQNSTTTIYNHSGTGVEDYSFTAASGENYTITASTT
jgi:hypothetical protein